MANPIEMTDDTLGSLEAAINLEAKTKAKMTAKVAALRISKNDETSGTVFMVQSHNRSPEIQFAKFRYGVTHKQCGMAGGRGFSKCPYYLIHEPYLVEWLTKGEGVKIVQKTVHMVYG